MAYDVIEGEDGVNAGSLFRAAELVVVPQSHCSFLVMGRPAAGGLGP